MSFLSKVQDTSVQYEENKKKEKEGTNLDAKMDSYQRHYNNTHDTTAKDPKATAFGGTFGV